jgi:hypothetical protein
MLFYYIFAYIVATSVWHLKNNFMFYYVYIFTSMLIFLICMNLNCIFYAAFHAS